MSKMLVSLTILLVVCIMHQTTAYEQFMEPGLKVACSTDPKVRAAFQECLTHIKDDRIKKEVLDIENKVEGHCKDGKPIPETVQQFIDKQKKDLAAMDDKWRDEFLTGVMDFSFCIADIKIA